MADNVVLSAGTADGVTLATDDVGGVHYQIVKLTYGALDSATLVDTTNRLPTVATQSGTWTVQPGNTANTTAWLVTGTGGTFPVTDSGGTLSIDDGAGSITVDGTVTVTDGAGSLTVDGTVTANLAAGTNNIGDVDVLTVPADPFGVNADAASATGSISAKLRFIAATGIPITGTVAVTQSGAWSLSANQSVNVAQLAGTTTDTNSGNKSAGTLRVVLATDQPQLTNKLLVTPDANSAVNCAQIAGTSTATGNGTASAGCQRVTIASDNTAFSVNATLKPATSGGLTVATGSITATATAIKGSAGQVYGWYFYNPNASVAYVQFFNTAAASVTLGTTTPVYSLGIPATSGANVMLETGIAHSTAIAIGVTTTRAGSTSPGSSVDYNIFYN